MASLTFDRHRYRIPLPLGVLLWTCCVLGAGLIEAGAQTLPMFVSAAAPIHDEFGLRLVGHPDLPPEQGDRVEIHLALGGLAEQPSADGTPTTNNPPVDNGVTFIGNQVAAADAQPAVFSIGLTQPLPAGTRFFARVFNAPTVDTASFYGDSEVLTSSGYPGQGYKVSITNMLPLDTADPDTDGLVNSWERSLSTDPDNPDTDADGMRDGDEFRADTDPLDPLSYFALSDVAKDGPDRAAVIWESVPGKRYQVERIATGDLLSGSFSTIGDVVTAISAVSTSIVSEADTQGSIFYRVRLVEE